MSNLSDQQDTEHGQENATKTPEETMAGSIIRSAIGLGLFAILTAGLIATTQLNTADRIVEQQTLARSKALFEIVPASKHDNDMLSDAFWVEAGQLGLEAPAEVFVAKSEGVSHTLILPIVAPDGYTGPIKMIIGIDQQGIVQGVRVTSHKETPGLGDKIDIKKSTWIESFKGRSLANTQPNQWKVAKDGGDFDQFTGATITPRAVVHAVHQALRFYHTHQVKLSLQSPGAKLSITE